MSTGRQIVCGHCGKINRLPAERAAGAARCGSCHQPIFSGHPIEVDEQGATAAAATGVFAARALAVDDALHMVVDKPYLFAPRDRQSGFILIAGYVAKAPKGTGA